jgi:dual 3',5'-cyclic-AMP and -GMP phosphodiesterase 11
LDRLNDTSICASRRQNLLEVVHDLFEEQTSLEKVTLKIMQRAQRLLKCERAAVLLLDESADGVKFSKLFELTTAASSTNHMRYGVLKRKTDISVPSARKQSHELYSVVIYLQP